MLDQTLKSRGFVSALHVGLWLLLLLTLNNWRGKGLVYEETIAPRGAPRSDIPVARLEALLASAAQPPPAVSTNAIPLFATRHFTPPPPAPATTRKFAVTYQGFFQTDNGPRQALVALDGTPVSQPVGGQLTSNLFVADLTFTTLTLTNAEGQANVLNINTQRVVEVPIP
jgi:hypothetical protein